MATPNEQALCLVKHRPTANWIVTEWSAYQQSQSEYKAPLEVFGNDDKPAMLFVAEQMNKQETSERFWLYNAHRKLPSGGRIAYARLAHEMANARKRDEEETGGDHAPGNRTVPD